LTGINITGILLGHERTDAPPVAERRLLSEFHRLGGRASILAAVLIAVGGAPVSRASAQLPAGCQADVHVCRFVTGIAPDGANMDYRIASHTFDLLSNVPRSAGEAVVVTGAETWNNQANGATFRLTHLNASQFDPTCGANGYNLVKVVDTSIECAGFGMFRGRCKDPQTDNWTNWNIEINTHYDENYWNSDPMSCVEIDWSVATPGVNQIDLLGSVVHEFGHAMGLGHPCHEPAQPPVTAAVMGPGASGPAGERRRDLYRWDIECSNETGVRLREIRRHWNYSNGTLQQTGARILPSWLSSKATPEYSLRAGTWVVGYNWTHSSISAPTSCWEHQNQSNDFCSGTGPGTGTVAATLAEDAGTHDNWFRGTDQEFVGVSINPTNYDIGDRRVLHVRSSNGNFGGTPGRLEYCSEGMGGGWMNCYLGLTRPLTTARRLAVTHVDAQTDSGADTVSLFAWSHQDRLYQTPPLQNREILLSAGRVSNHVLPYPHSTGLRTSVGPAVACNPAHESWSCIVVYASDEVNVGQVRVHRFWVTTNQFNTHYIVHQETGGGLPPWIPPSVVTRTVATNLRTGSDLAAWVNDGRWWIAVRPISTDAGQQQFIRVYSSHDAISWQLESTLNGTSVMGPAAISTKRSGSNQILRVQ
jgi:hypothetical protein